MIVFKIFGYYIGCENSQEENKFKYIKPSNVCKYMEQKRNMGWMSFWFYLSLCEGQRNQQPKKC